MRLRRGLLLTALALGGCGGDTGDITLPDAPRAQYAKPLGTAVTIVPLRTDEAYRKALVETFTSVTPENELKWEVVQPSKGRFRWSDGDAIVDAVRARGMRVRGHPFVWDQQLPKWVTAAPEREREAILRTHVRTVAEHYRGRVAQWDVVNEPLEDDGTMTPTVFQKAMGDGYIDVAFREARRADPQAKLFLNEIAAERGVKARALVRLVRGLRERGVPIDGVGLQNHTTGDDFPSQAELARLMRSFERLGVAVEITEMDVTGPDEQRRARGYEAAARACMEAPNCTGLTVWGVTDRRSWLGAAKKPTLFDADGKAKPALEAVRRVLAKP